MALYDTIRKNYAQTRRSDPRIAKKILEILASSPATIADILAVKGLMHILRLSLAIMFQPLNRP
jgi:hypothetical protein